ncbi:hypothetical protein [Candidatus Amarobacter glycogenicus]|uniref:hypothetical protein n=1 Tax=Candidatus Amarobacter glycogenicus TaxID=3140699 RepID=UPI003136D042|nr:hypothetical protein [Dehalococcoidia bacterium]
MHTIPPDGTGTHQDLVAAAGQPTRFHHRHRPQCPGLAGRRLALAARVLLVGEEVNDASLQPEINHCLVSGRADRCQARTRRTAGPDQRGAARSQGAVTFLAHPIERIALAVRHLRVACLEVNGFTGIELWNFMSEFRYYAWSKLHALPMLYLPRFFTRPWPEMLAKWDELLPRGRSPSSPSAA